ncbi:MAG: hypothetical protein ACRD44_17195 [Bryobacteraceae bacterium]
MAGFRLAWRSQRCGRLTQVAKAPLGRTTVPTQDFQYSSQVTTYVEMCSGDTCYDGQFTATSDLTEEYCTPTSQSFQPPLATQQNQVAPWVQN